MYIIVYFRARDDDPGLHEAEAGFIRLLDKLTNGSKIEVNETGTSLSYQPGSLLGGKGICDLFLRNQGWLKYNVACTRGGG